MKWSGKRSLHDLNFFLFSFLFGWESRFRSLFSKVIGWLHGWSEAVSIHRQSGKSSTRHGDKHRQLLLRRFPLINMFTKVLPIILLCLDSDYMAKNYLLTSQIQFPTHLFIFSIIYLSHIYHIIKSAVIIISNNLLSRHIAKMPNLSIS